MLKEINSIEELNKNGYTFSSWYYSTIEEALRDGEHFSYDTDTLHVYIENDDYEGDEAHVTDIITIELRKLQDTLYGEYSFKQLDTLMVKNGYHSIFDSYVRNIDEYDVLEYSSINSDKKIIITIVIYTDTIEEDSKNMFYLRATDIQQI